MRVALFLIAISIEDVARRGSTTKVSSTTVQVYLVLFFVFAAMDIIELVKG